MTPHSQYLLEQARLGAGLDRETMLALESGVPLAELMAVAGALRDEAHGGVISYSRKIFIPLTHLCRDVCHYCTFAKPPRKGMTAYMSRDEVLAVARAGAEAGCKEALFTLGDKPEMRYGAARQALDDLGHATTLSYLAEVARLVFEETGLLPHVNPGVMSHDDILGPAGGLRLTGLDAGKCGRSALREGRPSLWLAG